MAPPGFQHVFYDHLQEIRAGPLVSERWAKDWSYEPDEGLVLTQEQCGEVESGTFSLWCAGSAQLSSASCAVFYTPLYIRTEMNPEAGNLHQWQEKLPLTGRNPEQDQAHYVRTSRYPLSSDSKPARVFRKSARRWIVVTEEGRNRPGFIWVQPMPLVPGEHKETSEKETQEKLANYTRSLKAPN